MHFLTYHFIFFVFLYQQLESKDLNISKLNSPRLPSLAIGTKAIGNTTNSVEDAAELQTQEHNLTNSENRNELDKLAIRVDKVSSELKEFKTSIALQNMFNGVLNPILGFFKKSIFALTNSIGKDNGQKTEIHVRIGEGNSMQTSEELEQKKGIQPKNRWQNNWGSTSSFFLLKPNFVKAVHTGKPNDLQRLFAQFPLSGISYFEVHLIRKQTKINTTSIGLWMKSSNTFYSYADKGLICGHTVVGIGGYPTFGEGDTVGCGLNTSTMEIIYTKNGQPLNTSNLFVFETTDLLPFVQMFTFGDVIEANFGPNFVYQNISTFFN